MEHWIELPPDQVRELERLAALDRRSVDELVRLAVSDYLVRRSRDWSVWGRRFDELVVRVQSRVPPDVGPDDIEADISLAREDVRATMDGAARADPLDTGRA